MNVCVGVNAIGTVGDGVNVFVGVNEGVGMMSITSSLLCRLAE